MKTFGYEERAITGAQSVSQEKKRIEATSNYNMLLLNIEWWADVLTSFTAILGGMAGVVGVLALIATNEAGKIKDKKAEEVQAETTKLLSKNAAQIAAANTRAEEAKARAEEAKLALAKLALETGPRVSKFNLSRFAELLAAIPPGNAVIYFNPGDAEADQFAQGISHKLATAKWEVGRPKPIPENTESQIPLGLVRSEEDSEVPVKEYMKSRPIASRIGAGPLSFRLFTTDESKVEVRSGFLLMKAFKDAGFPNSLMKDEKLPDDKVVIIVGPAK